MILKHFIKLLNFFNEDISQSSALLKEGTSVTLTKWYFSKDF